MYTEVASKLAVVFGTKVYSQAVSMAGANAVKVEGTCFVIGGGNIAVQLQGSNDLQNWSDQGTAIAVSAVGYFVDTVDLDAIAYQYVRLEFDQASSLTGIVAAGINTANL